MTDMLQGDVEVPGLGKTKKKWIVVGGGTAAVYVAWRWYQASRNAGDTGPVSDYEVSGVGDGVGVVTGGTDGTAGSGNNNSETDGRNTETINNNAQWTQKAVEVLTNAGYDPMVVYAALGEFLARRSLDATEASIARASIAAVGQPPIGGPYSVIETSGPTVPGESQTSLPAPGNVRAWGAASATSLGLQWNAVDGAAKYNVYRPEMGSTPVGTVTGTTFTSSGLKAATTYKFTVAAVNSTGKVGNSSGTYSAKTGAGVTTPSTGTPPYTEVVAKSGDSISKIAARYGKSWQTVWNFNLKYRSKTTVAILKARGPHKIFSGTRIWVPK